MALPRFVVFRRQRVSPFFLCLFKEDVEKYGLLEFSGETVRDSSAKFAVEGSKRGNGLVHIRCCYNNKYIARESSNSIYLMARTEEPEEDQTSWSCTLFQPVQVEGSNFKFMHVQLGRYINHVTQPWTRNPCLTAGTNLANAQIYTMVDWEMLFTMPKHVSFKGDNGKYLSARVINEVRHLQFASEDRGDPTVRFEVIALNDGSIRIKSGHFGTFWRLSRVASNPNWILVDATETAADTSFWPIKIDDKTIALRQQTNNLFCGRFDGSGTTADCLRASVSSIAKTTRLELEEAVISRRVDNIVYRLMDAMIYNERALIVASNEAVNRTQVEHDMQLHFSYTESISSTWNAAVSGSFGIEASFRARIPFLIDKQISISVEISGGYEWGKTVEQSTEVSTTYDVTVSPNTKVVVRLLATEASYDVPFSYVQRDTLYDGSEIISEIDGGVFNGVNSYNFRYEIVEEKLDPVELMRLETSPKMVETKDKIRRSAL